MGLESSGILRGLNPTGLVSSGREQGRGCAGTAEAQGGAAARRPGEGPRLLPLETGLMNTRPRHPPTAVGLQCFVRASLAD